MYIYVYMGFPEGGGPCTWASLLLQSSDWSVGSPQTLAHMKVMAFQGNSMAGARPAPPMTLQPVADPDLTPSPDVPLAILKRRMMASTDLQATRGLLMEISAHLKVALTLTPPPQGDPNSSPTGRP